MGGRGVNRDEKKASDRLFRRLADWTVVEARSREEVVKKGEGRLLVGLRTVGNAYKVLGFCSDKSEERKQIPEEVALPRPLLVSTPYSFLATPCAYAYMPRCLVV
jgi:hypothetical protein